MGRRLRASKGGNAGLLGVVIRPGLHRCGLYRRRGTRARSGLLLWCTRRLLRSARVRWLGVGARFEYRAAVARKLRRILPQTCHDPVGVRYLIATEPPDVGRAGHLLFPGSAIFLRGRGTLRGQSAADRCRKAEENPQRSHAGSLSLPLRMTFQRSARVPHGIRLPRLPIEMRPGEVHRAQLNVKKNFAIQPDSRCAARENSIAESRRARNDRLQNAAI